MVAWQCIAGIVAARSAVHSQLPACTLRLLLLLLPLLLLAGSKIAAGAAEQTFTQQPSTHRKYELRRQLCQSMQ